MKSYGSSAFLRALHGFATAPQSTQRYAEGSFGSPRYDIERGEHATIVVYQTLVKLLAVDVADRERETRWVPAQPPQEARVIEAVPGERLIRVLRIVELVGDHQERRPVILEDGDDVVRGLGAVEEGDRMGHRHILR